MNRFIIALVLTLSFTIFTVTSCGNQGKNSKKITQSEIVKKNIEEYLQTKMNDPESYEFVELRIMDSILYKHNVKYRKDYFQRKLDSSQNDLEQQLDYQKSLPSMYDEHEVTKIRSEIEKDTNILSAIDSIEQGLGEKVNDVASYTYFFSFRGNNKLGVKVLNEYILQTDPAPIFGIKHLATDKDKVILNPNDFPGYKEMITKYIGQ